MERVVVGLRRKDLRVSIFSERDEISEKYWTSALFIEMDWIFGYSVELVFLNFLVTNKCVCYLNTKFCCNDIWP